MPPRVFGPLGPKTMRGQIPIHSLLFLYYVGSPKVPPRVFGPLGPKTLRGQKLQMIRDIEVIITMQAFE